VNSRGRFVGSCLRAIESVIWAKFKNLITTPPSWLQSITHTHTHTHAHAQPHEHMNAEEPGDDNDDGDNNNNKNNNNKYALYAAVNTMVS